MFLIPEIVLTRVLFLIDVYLVDHSVVVKRAHGYNSLIHDCCTGANYIHLLRPFC